jgi:hypothetical protein
MPRASLRNILAWNFYAQCDQALHVCVISCVGDSKKRLVHKKFSIGLK